MDILDILLDILLKPPQPFIGLFLKKLDELKPNRNSPKKLTIEERQVAAGAAEEGRPFRQVKAMAPRASPEVRANVDGAS